MKLTKQELKQQEIDYKEHVVSSLIEIIGQFDDREETGVSVKELIDFRKTEINSEDWDKAAKHPKVRKALQELLERTIEKLKQK